MRFRTRWIPEKPQTLDDYRNIDNWWSCLRCRRLFTKDPAELFCYDCLKEMS